MWSVTNTELTLIDPHTCQLQFVNIFSNSKDIIANMSRHLKDMIDSDFSIQPTIAVTQARLNIPEISQAIESKRLPIDGKIVTENCDIKVTKVAIEPVWYLPSIAQRFQIQEGELSLRDIPLQRIQPIPSFEEAVAIGKM